MSKPTISIIAVIGKNRELGKDNKLLWHIPDDLKHFRKVTLGHPVIMGQKTFESIGKILPKRLNIILSFDKSYKVKGAVVCHSVNEAIDFAKENEKNEIFFIGGARVFDQIINVADKLYLTVVDHASPADVYFPKYDTFKKVKKTGSGEYKDLKYYFLEMTRN